MLGALHMLGAVSGPGTGLADQIIVVRVNRVDAEKLKGFIGVKGVAAAGLGVALSVVDSQPKFALDIGLPVAKSFLRENLGIDAEITPANVAPAARGKSEFLPGVVAGAGLTALVFGVGWTTWKILVGRLFR
jgi:hypothetical protein